MKKPNTDTSEQPSPQAQASDDAKDTTGIPLKADSEKEDSNFYKIFMKDFEEGLKGIKSQQLKLVIWLIKHMSLKNEVNKSYREIAKASGISLQTVTTTIKLLEQGGFLCRNGTKGLMINPYAVFKGRKTKRDQVCYAYAEAKRNFKLLSDKELQSAEDELKETREQLKQLVKRQKELNELKEIEKKIKDLTYKKRKLNEQIEYHKWIKRSENVTRKKQASDTDAPSAPSQAQAEEGG